MPGDSNPFANISTTSADAPALFENVAGPVVNSKSARFVVLDALGPLRKRTAWAAAVGKGPATQGPKSPSESLIVVPVFVPV